MFDIIKAFPLDTNIPRVSAIPFPSVRFNTDAVIPAPKFKDALFVMLLSVKVTAVANCASKSVFKASVNWVKLY